MRVVMLTTSVLLFNQYFRIYSLLIPLVQGLLVYQSE